MPTIQSTGHSSRPFARMPRQLKPLHPSQRKLPFSELLEEIPDESHEEGFSLLYSEINKFLKNGICKKAASSKKSLWTQKHPMEFLGFASMVARPGADDEWEKLLKSRPYRCALLSGVMMMVLEKHVFSDLLFGAGPEHAQVLRMEDSSMVNIEGMNHYCSMALLCYSSTTRLWLTRIRKMSRLSTYGPSGRHQQSLSRSDRRRPAVILETRGQNHRTNRSTALTSLCSPWRRGAVSIFVSGAT